MLGEPDLDFTRLTGDAAGGRQVEVYCQNTAWHLPVPCFARADAAIIASAMGELRKVAPEATAYAGIVYLW